ncbi:unnamed protein product [Heterobilharzia americana]|nr:unnamed protein product [Heterobilharzia americana]CAH8642889.1 unnamed protein product [Heterobilharzia americana]
MADFYSQDYGAPVEYNNSETGYGSTTQSAAAGNGEYGQFSYDHMRDEEEYQTASMRSDRKPPSPQNKYDSGGDDRGRGKKRDRKKSRSRSRDRRRHSRDHDRHRDRSKDRRSRRHHSRHRSHSSPTLVYKYWDVPPPGFEHVTPAQYKALQASGQIPVNVYAAGQVPMPVHAPNAPLTLTTNVPFAGSAVCRQARRLYVGNIPFTATEENMMEFFNK